VADITGAASTSVPDVYRNSDYSRDRFIAVLARKFQAEVVRRNGIGTADRARVSGDRYIHRDHGSDYRGDHHDHGHDCVRDVYDKRSGIDGKPTRHRWWRGRRLLRWVSLGTVTTVYHGNAGGAGSFGAIVNADITKRND